MNQEAIELFYEEYGFIPSPSELENFIKERFGYNYFKSNSSNKVYNMNSTNELINELREIVGAINDRAKSSIRVERDERITEFTYMALAFLLKSSLYFLLQEGYKRNYQSLNI